MLLGESLDFELKLKKGMLEFLPIAGEPDEGDDE
jgi:hypothetical protein